MTAVLLASDKLNAVAMRVHRHCCGFSVQERHVGHRAALSFRVHHHTVPERQGNGCMVGMTDCSPGIDARIASHDLPTPAHGTRSSLQEPLVFSRGDPVRVPRAHVNDFTAGAEDLLHPMRFTGTTPERFIAQNSIFVHDQRRFRYEELFALTAKRAVLALVTFTGGDLLASEGFANIWRLKRIHGLAD
jgi:hypothetical protein